MSFISVVDQPLYVQFLRKSIVTIIITQENKTIEITEGGIEDFLSVSIKYGLFMINLSFSP